MRWYIVAGEPSGDLHASNVVKELKIIDNQAEIRGMGGDLMAAQGVHLTQHIRETNIMGFVEVVLNIRKMWNILKNIQKDIEEFKPDAVILVDYPGFNIRLAKYLHKKGIKVFYYISPQIWAWKKNRIHTLKKVVTKMFCILPFEKDFYKKEADMDVEFVGHPLVDALAGKVGQTSNLKEKYNLDQRPIVALLPGSRKQEIQNVLPVMCAVTSTFPNYQFVIAGAPTQEYSLYQSIIKDQNIPVINNRTYDLLNIAHAAVVTSGTATLETALFGIPQVVLYKGNWASFQIAKRIVNIPYISLVNLILQKPAVKELIQTECTPNHLATELNQILHDRVHYQDIKTDYEKLNFLLGGEGASKKVALALMKYVK